MPAYPGHVVILHKVIVETEDVLGCLEIRHGIFLGLIFGPGIFFGF